MKAIFKTILLLLLLSTLSLQGQIKNPQFFNATFSVPYHYDFNNHRSGVGLDMNYLFLITNFGFEFRYFDYNNVPDYKDASINAYIGLGFLNYMQLQYGISTNKYSCLRLRSDWRLSELGLHWYNQKDKNMLDNFTLHFSLEQDLKNDNFFVGVGFGYTWKYIKWDD
jgi:hypothetical protein